MLSFPGLEALKDPAQQELFLSGLLVSGNADSLPAFLEYHDTLTVAIEQSGVDRKTAEIEAAQAACSSLVRLLKQRRQAGDIDTIDAWDRTLRDTHGLGSADLPRNHKLPIVAAFYDQFEVHLMSSNHNNRDDPWHGDGPRTYFDLEEDWDTPEDERWW